MNAGSTKALASAVAEYAADANRGDALGACYFLPRTASCSRCPMRAP
jgi:hypothetical protein